MEVIGELRGKLGRVTGNGGVVEGGERESNRLQGEL